MYLMNRSYRVWMLNDFFLKCLSYIWRGILSQNILCILIKCSILRVPIIIVRSFMIIVHMELAGQEAASERMGILKEAYSVALAYEYRSFTPAL